jgi:catechol 2,3-dioxygenase-like lactoylglutathione lyase family enzyme
MNLGAFSVSLVVKDIKASKDFYEKLGFEVYGGEISQNYLITIPAGIRSVKPWRSTKMCARYTVP